MIAPSMTRSVRIAIAAMTNASKGSSYLAAIIVWLIGAIPIMLAAAM